MSETLIQPKADLDNVFTYLDRTREALAGHSPGIVAAYDRLRNESRNPDVDKDDQFRTRVAYAVQDMGREIGGVLPDSHPLKPEMDGRAKIYPGLSQPDVQQMMAASDRLEQRTVNAVRSLARDLVSGGQDPTHPDVQHVIKNLRETVADELKEGPAVETPPRMHRSPGEGTAPPDAGAKGAGNDPREASPGRTGPDGRADAAAEGKASPASDAPGQRGDQRGPATDGGPQPAQNGPAENGSSRVVKGFGFGRIADTLANYIETRPRQTSPDWMDRTREFSAQKHEARDRSSLDATEKAGREALDAMRLVREQPASAVMSAMSDAAKHDPNGMAGVLSEMKPGGKYADLHGQYSAEKQNNQAFAAQLDDASAKLGAYGKGREAAEAIGARLNESESVTKRFSALDASIAREAGELPGKDAGKSMFEELGEKASELAKKAIEMISSLVRPKAEASASPSP